MVGLIICIIIGGILFVKMFWVGKLIGGGILYHYFNIAVGNHITPSNILLF